MDKGGKKSWEEYCKQNLGAVTPLLLDEGFELESDQPHIQGERYILSGEKLVLYGVQITTNKRVVIKITSNTSIAQELEKERVAHEMLSKIRFAYHTFYSPKEILFGRRNVYTFYITEFVPQDKTFLERSLEEQFFFALKALEAQEGSHATTHQHVKDVRSAFDVYDGDRYLSQVQIFQKEIISNLSEKKTALHEEINIAVTTLSDSKDILNLYSSFLTHWDFVPHNIRINKRDIYLLDHTAIRFGNKYEGWARFMNFMTLHNPALEQALHNYIETNRDTDELEALRLMRIYRLVELIWFYSKNLLIAEDNLKTLTEKRIDFWSQVLTTQLDKTQLNSNVVEEYKKTRDTLRDKDELQRQSKLH